MTGWCGKAGKNRPLDEDDLAFIHERLDRERDKEATVAADEREQLAAFKQVQPSKLYAPACCYVRSSLMRTCWVAARN